MAVGGSLESISIDGRIFAPASDSDSNRKLGGYENEFQSNGNGTGRFIMTRIGWSISDLNVEIDNDRGDLEFLQETANKKSPSVISATYADGNTYQGSGKIVGEFADSSQSATVPLSLMGPGKLTKQ